MSITVRKMIKEDIDFVAKLYYEAFWGKVQPLKDLHEDDAVALIRKVLFSHNENMDYFSIALLDNQIVGLIKLMKNTSKDKYKMPSLKEFIKIGPIKLIISGITLDLLECDIKENQLYIDLLVVSLEMRGHGIGTILLDYAEELIQKDERLEYLTLSVIEKNIRAQKLYEQKGFNIVKSIHHSFIEKYADVKKYITWKRKCNDNDSGEVE